MKRGVRLRNNEGLAMAILMDQLKALTADAVLDAVKRVRRAARRGTAMQRVRRDNVARLVAMGALVRAYSAPRDEDERDSAA